MPPFVLFWLDALRELLADAGHPMQVHVSARDFQDNPALSLRKLTTRVNAAAWVLFRSSAAIQGWFAGQGIPTVVAGSCAQGVDLPSVDIDYRAACRHAAVMLRQKGHRTQALLLPEPAHGGDEESAQGFLEAFPEGSAELHVLRHLESVADLVDCLERAQRLRPAPTALVVARSHHALTVITHLLRQGYHPGRDIAVVSRDDDAFLAHLVPEMTRYSVDPAKFAKRLSRLVLELVETGRAGLSPVRLVPSLKVGKTV
jgi:DNA-binding LacI/PurR family transcriptional regulator